MQFFFYFVSLFFVWKLSIIHVGLIFLSLQCPCVYFGLLFFFMGKEGGFRYLLGFLSINPCVRLLAFGRKQSSLLLYCFISSLLFFFIFPQLRRRGLCISFYFFCCGACFIFSLSPLYFSCTTYSSSILTYCFQFFFFFFESQVFHFFPLIIFSVVGCRVKIFHFLLRYLFFLIQ